MPSLHIFFMPPLLFDFTSCAADYAFAFMAIFRYYAISFYARHALSRYAMPCFRRQRYLLY